MNRPTWGLTYWPIFLLIEAVVFLAGFGPAETIALLTSPANSLSDFAWFEFGFPLHGGHSLVYTAAWYFSLAAYVVVVVFLGVHIWLQKLR